MGRKGDFILLENVTISDIIHVMNKKGYKVFYDGSPNLIGVRNSCSIPNTFNDLMFDMRVLKNGTGSLKEYLITTDPGLYWLNNPMNVNGTAILKPGQHRGMWAMGLHQGKYEALVQVKPCTVIRDFNRDSKLDFNSDKEETGLFGINCHHANINPKTVDRWSAGCQVHQDLERYESIFMGDMKKARDKWGNSFTYTLLLESDFSEVV